MRVLISNIGSIKKFLLTLMKPDLKCLVGIIFINSKILWASSLLLNTAYTNNHNSFFLEMNASIKQAKNWERGSVKKLDSATVVIYNSLNQVVKNLNSTKAGRCVINLPLNERFVIRVSKRGWVTKIIEVDTRITRRIRGKYRLNFEVDMFEDIIGLDASVLNKPIANIVYNRTLDRFDYNYKYTDGVNKKLIKLYSDYYRLHRENTIDRNTAIKTIIADTLRSGNLNSNATVLFTDSNSSERSFIGKLFEGNSTSLSNTGAKATIVFKIQIIALDGALPSNAKFFEKCGKAKEHIHNGKYKYTLGEFKTIESALLMLSVVKGVGYRDAFPVAFLNNERITVTEARAFVNASNK